MVLLLDIGNTHVHCGLADARRLRRRWDFPTVELRTPTSRAKAGAALREWVGRDRIMDAAVCSVVPAATARAVALVRRLFSVTPVCLNHTNLRGLGIDYPKLETIGQDRLANALAARTRFGAPVITIGFGTAVIIDVVNSQGAFVGGVIAPGLDLVTSYLHEKTAQLPVIQIREPRSLIGRSTEEAMRVGAVVGYRGYVRELIGGLKRELNVDKVPVIATGGYAPLLAKHLPEITQVERGLTLEGVRLWWLGCQAAISPPSKSVR